jgi:methylmalonyl-CoA/ethylmalonyl-CoA epimerase
MEIIQVAQRVTDLDRAAAFYERLLGEPPVGRFVPPGLVFFQLGATRLLLEAGAPPAMLYLGFPDVRVTVEELRSAGVTIENEPHVIFRHEDAVLGPAGTDEWQAFIRDSEDNLVGLVSFEPTTPAES